MIYGSELNSGTTVQNTGPALPIKSVQGQLRSLFICWRTSVRLLWPKISVIFHSSRGVWQKIFQINQRPLDCASS